MHPYVMLSTCSCTCLSWKSCTYDHFFIQLLNVESDGYLSLMDEGGCVREDLCLPEGKLGATITQLFESGQEVVVTVTKAADQEAITAASAQRNHKARGRGMNSM